MPAKRLALAAMCEVDAKVVLGAKRIGSPVQKQPRRWPWHLGLYKSPPLRSKGWRGGEAAQRRGIGEGGGDG